MRHRSDTDWEELARREPYFAVLTEEQYLSDNLSEETQREFFNSGQADVSHVFDLASGYLGGPINPTSALDFGCGAGRLTLALAERVPYVIGVDVAPTMLQLAGRHAAAAGASNVELVSDLDALSGKDFDFICSLIVFQHIPVERGEALFRRLLALLRPDGVIVVQFVFDRKGGALKQLARRLRASSPLLHRALQVFERERVRLPYIQMNSYDRRRVVALMKEAGCRTPALVPTNHGGIGGAIVISVKRPQ